VSAHEELEASARAAGKAGKSYTDWSFSDEVSEAVGALDRKDRRVDTARFEAAFCEGRREYREGGGWKSVWTTAPADYDGFGTETAEGPFEWDGKQLRRVLVDPGFYGWQTGRYPVCWDEDPREVEAKIKAKLAAEKAEREAREQRRAEGLVWIRTVEQFFLNGNEDVVDEEARAHGLGWEDVRAERRRRTEEKAAAERAAKWAVCRAAFKDGDTLVDDGAPSREGQYGFRIPGRDPRVWRSVTVRPHYAVADDAEEARVVVWKRGKYVVEEDFIGSLENVAGRIARGELRVARPDEVFPPKVVVDRLCGSGQSWKDVFRAPSGAWVGCPLFGQTMVLDDAGRLVRKKAVVEAALVAYRENKYGGGS